MNNKMKHVITLILMAIALAGLQGQASYRPELPVYKIVTAGITEDQARALIKSLGVDYKTSDAPALVDQNGLLSYIDKRNFQAVPTKTIGRGEVDEDKNRTVIEAVDINSLMKMKPLPGEYALERFKDALARTGLLPGEAEADIKYTKINFQYADETKTFSAAIDTKISFTRSLKGIPLTGPGAVISAVFSPEGTITSLRYANRTLSAGKKVPLLTEKEIIKLLYKKYGRDDLKITPHLTYYAPELKMSKAEVILPYYSCEITDPKGEINYLNDMIPALYGTGYLPVMEVTLKYDGKVIYGEVKAKGGKEPYNISWNISGAYRTEGNRIAIYSLDAREFLYEQKIPVSLVDSNGVKIFNVTDISVDPYILNLPPPVAADTDFGTENSVTNQFGDLEQTFVDQMLADGVTKRFQWKGTNAWEQDFKNPTDTYYVDETDITFYVGHGSPTGFSFEDTTHDDSKLDDNDADDDWGERDLEWLALYSCRVLKTESGGNTVFKRWKQEFDGLHLLLGFHTLAWVNSGFSGAFASNMLDSGQTVRQAWFNAIDSHQPSTKEVTGVVMGVIKIDGNGNWIWNYNDHFWGHGSVGPDIDSTEADLYWYMTHEN